MNLQKTQLNEEGAEILAKAFRSASNLTDVDLSENSIRAYGDGAIANALPCSSIVLYIFLFIRILPRCLAHASVAASTRGCRYCYVENPRASTSLYVQSKHT